MDMNRIQNSTIAKLDRTEIGTLGLFNAGVMTYLGEIKSRRNGYKVEKVNEYQTNFVAEHYRMEFIKIQQRTDEPEIAMRMFNFDTQSYEQVQPLWGLDFLKQ